MNERRKYERRLNRSRFTANLRTAICVQGFVLVMGTLLITNSRASDELMIAVVFTAVQLAWAYFASTRYKLACSGIAVPNLVIAFVLFLAFSVTKDAQDPLVGVWFISTSLLGLVAVVLARATGGGEEVSSTLHAPDDDA